MRRRAHVSCWPDGHAHHSMKRRAFAAVTILTACGDTRGSAPTLPGEAPSGCVALVEVRPAALTLHVGDTARFTAAACSVSNTWTWRSSDTAVIIVIDSAGGLARARATGIATLIAHSTANSGVAGAAAVSAIP